MIVYITLILIELKDHKMSVVFMPFDDHEMRVRPIFTTMVKVKC